MSHGREDVLYMFCNEECYKQSIKWVKYMPLMTHQPQIIDMVANEKYIIGCYIPSKKIIFNLPEVSNVGDTLEIYCTANFLIQPGCNQQILFFATMTESGETGCIESHGPGQWIKLICTYAHTEWMHVDSRGNFFIV